MKEVLRDTFKKQGQDLTLLTLFEFKMCENSEKAGAGLSREKMMRKYEESIFGKTLVGTNLH